MPVTWQRPRTAVTFDFLKTFQLLSLTAKTTLWDYHQTVQYKADNATVRAVSVSFSCVS